MSAISNKNKVSYMHLYRIHRIHRVLAFIASSGAGLTSSRLSASWALKLAGTRCAPAMELWIKSSAILKVCFIEYDKGVAGVEGVKFFWYKKSLVGGGWRGSN